MFVLQQWDDNLYAFVLCQGDLHEKEKKGNFEKDDSAPSVSRLSLIELFGD